MSRFILMRQDVRTDSAKAISNIKNKCFNIATIAAVSTMVLSGLPVIVAASDPVIEVGEICSTINTPDVAPCDSDPGTSEAANLFKLSSNIKTGTYILGDGTKITKSTNGNPFIYTLATADGDAIGTITHNTSTNTVSYNLNAGFQVVIRVQYSNEYQYHLVEGQGSIAGINDSWLHNDEPAIEVCAEGTTYAGLPYPDGDEKNCNEEKPPKKEHKRRHHKKVEVCAEGTDLAGQPIPDGDPENCNERGDEPPVVCPEGTDLAGKLNPDGDLANCYVDPDLPDTGFLSSSEVVSGTTARGVGLMPLGIVAVGAMLVRRSYKIAAKREANK